MEPQSWVDCQAPAQQCPSRRSFCRQPEQDLQYDKTRQCGKTEGLRAMPLVAGAQSSYVGRAGVEDGG